MTWAARRLRPTPAQQLRERLAAAKAAGVPFDEAWRQAQVRLYVRGGERPDWRAVLEDAAVLREWRAAYEDAPSPLAPLAGVTVEDVMAAGRGGIELELAA